MKPDLSCECGHTLFSTARVVETFPDGRAFELASIEGEIPHVLILTCLKCGERYAMGSRPKKDHQNTLLRLGSPEADAFIEDQRPPEGGVWKNEHAVDVPGQS